MPRASQRKTRIVATVGPASCSPAMLRKLIRAGVDVFRLNFSHGSAEFHEQTVRDVRRQARELGQAVAILQDLRGPKMRLGLVRDDAIRLTPNSEVQLVERSGVGTPERLCVEAAGAIAKLGPGDTIRLADGLLELSVVARSGEGVVARVIHGGVLRSRQGVNIPCVDLGVKALTRKDRKDLALGLELGVDAVALSFVQDEADVKTLRRIIAKRDPPPFLISKIERAEALDHLDDIVAASDGVMVARGDLGVEIGMEKVPMAQRRIIRRAMELGRPVITATQMLESMIERPTPTRAEVSDVANAVLEGTDALMLSGETAVGKHPVAAVRALVTVAREVEQASSRWERPSVPADDVSAAVAKAAQVAARAVEARAVLGFTNSGRTVRLIASQRPRRDHFGFTHSESTLRRMRFFWGVTPLLISRARTVEGMLRDAEALLAEKRLVKRGDRVVIVCGEEVHTGATNSMRIHTVGGPRGDC